MLASRLSSAIAAAWLGWASTEAATKTLVSRKTGSAAIVAVEGLAAEIATDPAHAALQRGWDEVLGRRPKPFVPGAIGDDTSAVLRRESREFPGEAVEFFGRTRHGAECSAGLWHMLIPREPPPRFMTWAVEPAAGAVGEAW